MRLKRTFSLHEVTNARVIRDSGGFTLFEVVLAIALAAVLLALVGTAVEVFLRSAESNHLQVDEAQLARSVLQRMASDLRSAIRYQPQDTSTALTLAKSAAAFDVDSLDAVSPSDPSAASDPTAASEDIAESTTPPIVLGVYGNAAELQVDISRIPRLDEMEALFGAPDAPPTDRPSDIKTVAYFLRPGEEVRSDSVRATGIGENRNQVAGLVRRSVDRATARWAAENGGGAMLDQRGELLAPEVIGLEFQYFDGDQWRPEWDSEEQGGLPVAILIRIAVRSARRTDEQDSSRMRLTNHAPENTNSYEMVINLPNAVPLSDASL